MKNERKQWTTTRDEAGKRERKKENKIEEKKNRGKKDVLKIIMKGTRCFPSLFFHYPEIEKLSQIFCYYFREQRNLMKQNQCEAAFCGRASFLSRKMRNLPRNIVGFFEDWEK